MSRKSRITLTTLAIIVALAAVAVALFDWNMLRGFVEREVTERTGRQLTIAGNLNVHLSLPPRIRAEKVTLANASWGREDKMLDVAVLEFTLALKPLLHGDIVLPEVALSQPVIALERSADGKRNWVLKADQAPTDRSTQIQRLTVDKGTLIFHDPTLATDIKAAVNTDSAASDPQRAVRFNAEGRFKGLPATARGDGGSVLSLQDATLPYPIKADVSVGDTKAKVDGTITGLISLSAVDLALDLTGADLADLYAVVRLPTPTTPPYHVTGRLRHTGKVWQFDKFAGKVGASDLSGNLRVDRAGVRPRLTGDASSKLLDFGDLAGMIGAEPKPGGDSPSTGRKLSADQKKVAAQTGRALPDRPFKTGRLSGMDADVQLKAHSIRREGLPLDNLSAHVLVNDGIMKLTPFNFGIAGGHMVSDINIDGRKEPMAAKADVKFSKLQLNKLFPKVELTKSSVGSLSGHAELTGEGNTFAKLLGSADGHLAGVIVGGQVSELLIELAGIDAAEIVKFLLAGDRNTTLRCAVAEFKITDGLMKTEVFVVDTKDTNISGSGTINLKNETLDLTLVPLPKDMSILSGRSPLHATGTFKKPNFTPDKTALAERGGAAILLALINPLLALVPLIETGPGKDSDCKELIATATQTKAKTPSKIPAKTQAKTGTTTQTETK